MNLSEEEIAAKEEARMAKALERSRGKVTVAPIKNKSTGFWNIHLKGLPTNKQNPVRVMIDGKEVFLATNDGKVNHKITEAIKTLAQSASITIKIPEMQFENNADFKVNAGENIKFEFTEQGLSVSQSTTPY